MPLQGWLMAGIAPRLIKSLELGNRNHGFKRPKDPMLPPPKNAVEREERIATVWMSHIQDSGFAINSYWSQSMDYRELKCALPTSTEEFRKKVRGHAFPLLFECAHADGRSGCRVHVGKSAVRAYTWCSDGVSHSRLVYWRYVTDE